MHSFWSLKLENCPLPLSTVALNQCNGMATVSAGNVIDYMKNLNCNSSVELRGKLCLSSSSPIFHDRLYSPTRHAIAALKIFQFANERENVNYHFCVSFAISDAKFSKKVALSLSENIINGIKKTTTTVARGWWNFLTVLLEVLHIMKGISDAATQKSLHQ